MIHSLPYSALSFNPLSVEPSDIFRTDPWDDTGSELSVILFNLPSKTYLKQNQSSS